MADFNIEHVRRFDFTQLFVDDLGWDRPAQQQPYSLVIGEEVFALDVVAHKRGVQLLHCRPDTQGQVPTYATRQKIERKVTAEAREHLIVFTDTAKTIQVWQWVSRLPGKPVQYREVFFRRGDTAELLKQKLSRLRFTLDEEALLTVLGVTARLEDAIPRDKVTKKFYAEFKKQRAAFEQFIDGIPKLSDDLHWYAAVLIDRLMFIWFLQEKKFLDGQKRYLQDRLAAHQAGTPVHSFYKAFLCPLFFRGFAEERTDNNRAQISAQFGQVPYLNGGLFSRHELEERYGASLDVADAALEKLFGFFDAWEWHLDDRPLKNDREINPDVLGYIFEKFVNEEENQKGAYYTKEDITEYIGKNAIIPALLHKVRSKYPGAFDALAWSLLQAEPDRYIYPAMLKGVDRAYPAEIEAGRDTEAPHLPARRKAWNSKTLDAWALPTEIWRETIARHDRTRELRAKLAAGELGEIGDLITWNLDIRRFAQDVIERCTDAALLREFWAVLAGRVPRNAGEKFRPALSVLDPTCGSGAFLFAALNILKPLYDATLGTMGGLLLDADQAGDHKSAEKWKDIQETTERFGALRGDRASDYAVIKHIVVHNLYGVDIEEQATEIAKLRLFLKLVSLLEPGDTIEPLPDIDFNIRHGNTLVGYATADETEAAVRGATQGNLFSDAWEDIRLRLTAVEEAYHNFQIQQVQRGGHVTTEDKRALSAQLVELEEMLNFHLCRAGGADPSKGKIYEDWKTTNKPFHWYIDFFPLMAAGGFDAIVGNPPYAEIPKGFERTLLRSTFKTALEKWSRDEDLYALVLERSLKLLDAQHGKLGMILPLSVAFSTKRSFAILREVLTNDNGDWFWSHFDRIPSALFGNEVRTRCTIAVLSRSSPKDRRTRATTSLLRWNADYRADLFSTLHYSQIESSIILGIPKIGSRVQSLALAYLTKTQRPLATDLLRSISYEDLAAVAPEFPTECVFVGGTAYNWFPAWRDIPDTTNAAGARSLPARTAGYQFSTEEEADIVLALLCSSLGYWWWSVVSDGFNLKRWLLERFPVSVSMISESDRPRLGALGKTLRNKLQDNYVYKDNKGRIGNFYLPACEREISAIDTLLAKAVPGLTTEFLLDIQNSNICFSRVQVDADGDTSQLGD